MRTTADCHRRNQNPVNCRRPVRRGSAYLIVLGAAMIVGVLGMSSLLALRVQRRSVEGTVAAAQARLNAQMAVEIGLHKIAEDVDWRTNNSHGDWFTDRSAGVGRFSLAVVDPDDASLIDDPTDSIVITGTGVVGRARQKMSVTLTPQIRGVEALEAAMHAGGLIWLDSATVQADGVISSNDRITAGSSQINADAEAVVGTFGTTYNGARTAGIEARTMPPATVFDAYVAAATLIDVNDLPLDSGFHSIDRVVLSPANNPFGAANGQGIYLIDCLDRPLRIRRSRIVGTLVILNPGIGSVVDKSVHWVAAVANYPTLLVSGDIDLEIENAPLNEADEGVNFNPAGTPYQSIADSDTDDSYPSEINGLVYVSGNLDLSQKVTVTGVVVVGGGINAGSELYLTYNSLYLNDPPPGFLDPTRLKVVPGSWRKGVD